MLLSQLKSATDPDEIGPLSEEITACFDGRRLTPDQRHHTWDRVVRDVCLSHVLTDDEFETLTRALIDRVMRDTENVPVELAAALSDSYSEAALKPLLDLLDTCIGSSDPPHLAFLCASGVANSLYCCESSELQLMATRRIREFRDRQSCLDESTQDIVEFILSHWPT